MSHKHVWPSGVTARRFKSRRYQDQRGRDEVSTSSAIAPAPRKEVGGQQAERDGTTIAKKKARLVEKAKFRPYASVMR